MASNYTEHFGLCQWEATDQVRREEFNQDNTKVDTALNALAEKDTALESAVSAIASAAGNCQMELITYTGTGTPDSGSSKKIEFTQLPDIFIVAGDLAIIIGQGGNTTPLLIADDTIYHETFINTTTAKWIGSKLLLPNSTPRYQMNTKGAGYWVLGLYMKNT